MVSAFEFRSLQLHSTYSCQQGSCEMEDWSLSYHPNQDGPKGYQVGGKGEGGPKGNFRHCFAFPPRKLPSLGGGVCTASQPGRLGLLRLLLESQAEKEGAVERVVWEIQPSPTQSPGCRLLLARCSPPRSNVRFRLIQDTRALVPPPPCCSGPHTPSLS